MCYLFILGVAGWLLAHEGTWVCYFPQSQPSPPKSTTFLLIIKGKDNGRWWAYERTRIDWYQNAIGGQGRLGWNWGYVSVLNTDHKLGNPEEVQIN